MGDVTSKNSSESVKKRKGIDREEFDIVSESYVSRIDESLLSELKRYREVSGDSKKGTDWKAMTLLFDLREVVYYPSMFKQEMIFLTRNITHMNASNIEMVLNEGIVFPYRGNNGVTFRYYSTPQFLGMIDDIKDVAGVSYSAILSYIYAKVLVIRGKASLRLRKKHTKAEERFKEYINELLVSLESEMTEYKISDMDMTDTVYVCARRLIKSLLYVFISDFCKEVNKARNLLFYLVGEFRRFFEETAYRDSFDLDIVKLESETGVALDFDVKEFEVLTSETALEFIFDGRI